VKFRSLSFLFQFYKKPVIRLVVASFLLILGSWIIVSRGGIVAPTWADEIEDLQKQIDELAELRKLSEDATKPLEGELDNLESQISNARAGIVRARNEATALSESIDQREEDLAVQYVILSERIVARYKRSRLMSPLLMLFSTSDASKLTQDLAYRSSVEAQDNRLIREMGQEIEQLEADREKLEQDQVRLAALEEQLDEQAEFFRVEINKAKDYQNELSKQIAELSKRQQEILAEKTETFQTTVGDVPLADDAASRPDYNPGFSPAFAAFSFGAPHFKGMSQYGAYGRAQSGQSVEQILKAYYGDGIEIKKDYANVNITVSDYGHTVDLETYVKRIYEVPSSWGDNGGMEALKAQAVAARSYALARTNNGASSICATEACQVYKPSNKGGNWERAVNETKGWVLLANGQPFSAWYASTSGGFQESYTAQGHTTPAIWDAVGGRSGWTSQAYEKIAGSPWFYKGWYKSRGGDACGRSHPWLNSSEMADILNAWVVLIKHGQSDDRVTPIGSCWGGNPYSINELRDKAQSLSTGYNSVNSVSVTYSSDGYTAEVVFNTDKGEVKIPGLDFKKAFNLRAPGNIALKSGLFNIESK
jgi:peptidoglycan hydrolase-like amidase/peptidoglycan hydrolase CwlO-like protein